ncbi:hypothetical protein KEM48_012829, partial [Puccinia striiformis f. sp. tritici PST-130]
NNNKTNTISPNNNVSIYPKSAKAEWLASSLSWDVSTQSTTTGLLSDISLLPISLFSLEQPPPQQQPHSPAVHNTKTSETVLPSICAGFELQKLIEEPEVGDDEQQTTTTTSGVDCGRRQTPVQPEDRLDRLLAEMEAVSPTTLSFSNKLAFNPSITTPHLLPFAPVSKIATSICSSSFSEDAQFSESDSASCASGSQSSSSDPPFETIDHPSSPSTLMMIVLSRESYDRKGPLPIMKLNLREVIELKLIKEELGISPISPVSISPITSVSIVQSYSNSSSTSSLSPSDIGTSGSSVSLSPSSSISLSPCFSSSSELGPSPASSVNLSPAFPLALLLLPSYPLNLTRLVSLRILLLSSIKAISSPSPSSSYSFHKKPIAKADESIVVRFGDKRTRELKAIEDAEQAFKGR